MQNSKIYTISLPLPLPPSPTLSPSLSLSTCICSYIIRMVKLDSYSRPQLTRIEGLVWLSSIYNTIIYTDTDMHNKQLTQVGTNVVY